MQAISGSIGPCYPINLSRNLVPGTMYHTVDGVSQSVNAGIGLPADAKLTDVVNYFGTRLPKEERASYFRFFDRERLIDCFRHGETHVFHEYWSSEPREGLTLVQRHIMMYDDEESGDVLAISYVRDITDEFKLAELRKHAEKERKALKQDLSEARQANQEQIEQLKCLTDELEKSADQLDDERQQNELLLEQIYYSIFFIDLKRDTYEELYRQEGVAPLMRERGTASTELRQLCERFVVPKHRKQMIRFFDLTSAVSRLRHEESISTECKTMDGNWHQARFVVKERDEQGEVSQILYVTRVISEEKLREERLISIAEDANEANQAKTDFISQVAHELRTPMNSIFGFLEIAEANLDDREKLRSCLGKIRTAGNVLKDLVSDILDISSMESGKMKLNRVETSLAQVMEEFVVSIQSARFGKQQDIRFYISDLIQDWIVIDPLRLKQIYTNVMTNAIKYTPDGGQIDFTLSEEEAADPEHVCLVANVTDTGIGMSEEFMAKMFTKFERAADSRAKHVSGYGLGLAIVKQLVERMDGKIDVQSKLGEGTSFTIRLVVPRASGTNRVPRTQEETNDALCHGMHLLVAEDNELNREVIVELLAMHEITCDCAENGAVCVERFQAAEEGTYDAILMDMQMPHMDGLAAAKAIRALPVPGARAIPIIAMTANALKEDVQRCLAAGMNRHLSKPVDMKQLLKTLAEVKTTGGAKQEE